MQKLYDYTQLSVSIVVIAYLLVQSYFESGWATSCLLFGIYVLLIKSMHNYLEDRKKIKETINNILTTISKLMFVQGRTRSDN